MNLQIDVGNTFLKWRILDQNGVVQRGKGLVSDEGVLSDINIWSALQTIAIANVSSSDVLDQLLSCCRQHRPDIVPFIARSESSFNDVITCAYDNPGQLGVDRWLAIIAGYLRYKESCCVIDCGSAITIDVVAADGCHKGGYIMPGLALMRKSLATGTDQVLFDERDVVDTDYGTTTAECVHHGINYMVVALIEGVVRRVASEDVERVIFTGGDAWQFAKVGGGEFVPDLVLDGLSWVGGVEPLS